MENSLTIEIKLPPTLYKEIEKLSRQYGLSSEEVVTRLLNFAAVLKDTRSARLVR